MSVGRSGIGKCLNVWNTWFFILIRYLNFKIFDIFKQFKWLDVQINKWMKSVKLEHSNIGIFLMLKYLNVWNVWNFNGVKLKNEGIIKCRNVEKVNTFYCFNVLSYSYFNGVKIQNV